MGLVTSHSEIKKFRRCKRQYYYSSVERIEPRLPPARLKFGNWHHSLLQVHYSGGDWRAEHKRHLKSFDNLFLEEREYYGDLPEQVERAMTSYLFHWRKEESNWEVLYAEQSFEAEVVDGDILSFKPDLIVREISTDRIWCVDHKTVRSMPAADWRIEDLQSTLYPWGLRTLGLDVYGFLFNYIRQKAPSVPHINKDGSISRARIDTDFYTLAKFCKEYYAVEKLNQLPEYWRVQLKTLQVHNTYLKRSRITKDQRLVDRQVYELELTMAEMDEYLTMADSAPKGADPWVRTMIPSCDWDCDFYELCQAELLGSNVDFIRRNKYQESTYQKGRKHGRRTQGTAVVISTGKKTGKGRSTTKASH